MVKFHEIAFCILHFSVLVLAHSNGTRDMEEVISFSGKISGDVNYNKVMNLDVEGHHHHHDSCEENSESSVQTTDTTPNPCIPCQELCAGNNFILFRYGCGNSIENCACANPLPTVPVTTTTAASEPTTTQIQTTTPCTRCENLCQGWDYYSLSLDPDLCAYYYDQCQCYLPSTVPLYTSTSASIPTTTAAPTTNPPVTYAVPTCIPCNEYCGRYSYSSFNPSLCSHSISECQCYTTTPEGIPTSSIDYVTTPVQEVAFTAGSTTEDTAKFMAARHLSDNKENSKVKFNLHKNDSKTGKKLRHKNGSKRHSRINHNSKHHNKLHQKHHNKLHQKLHENAQKEKNHKQ